jgi:DNA-binding MarR family transcriptional regulator
VNSPAAAGNVLGALSQVITDQSMAAVADATGRSPTSAAALSALAEFLDRPTVDQLRKVLGLTPSGAVRLVDRLAAAGLVTRGPGTDGRSRSVTLTQPGRELASRITAARARVLDDMLAGMADRDRETLHRLMSRVMANAVRIKDGGAWICRLCDLESCERALGHCPAAQAAQQKYGVSAAEETT